MEIVTSQSPAFGAIVYSGAHFTNDLQLTIQIR